MKYLRSFEFLTLKITFFCSSNMFTKISMWFAQKILIFLCEAFLHSHSLNVHAQFVGCRPENATTHQTKPVSRPVFLPILFCQPVFIFRPHSLSQCQKKRQWTHWRGEKIDEKFIEAGQVECAQIKNKPHTESDDDNKSCFYSHTHKSV